MLGSCLCCGLCSMMSDYKVALVDDNVNDFYVVFSGPKESPYEGGRWKVHVELPNDYPYKSPSIGFCNRIFHPNVDELSGAVCLDVINQRWSPMFDLLNIFESFLPQLLLYPNPTDPLNGEAAGLLLREPVQYSAKVKEYVIRYGQASLDAEQPCKAPTTDDMDDEDEALSYLSDGSDSL